MRSTGHNALVMEIASHGSLERVNGAGLETTRSKCATQLLRKQTIKMKNDMRSNMMKSIAKSKLNSQLTEKSGH